jgi:ATP-dependent RNA helicase RhlE
MSFKELNLIEPILSALESEGYINPTPIQKEAIPIILKGKDILGCAQTGTGKTAAFAIPIIQLLQKSPNLGRKRSIRALILSPTRELAIQIADSLTAYGKNTPLKHTVVYGGVSQKAQTDSLRNGVDILVATPGRLLDLMNQGYINLGGIELFVLDEADRMLDMGFINDIRKIIVQLPVKRQTLFFSATMAKEALKLADQILVRPERVQVTPVSSTANTVQQEVYFVEKNEKRKLLNHLLENKDYNSILVFTRTKHGADKVTKDLQKSGITAEAIHGNKSQNARQKALSNFKGGKTRILVATDIAARGIDVDDLALVINFELPNQAETYVHRIGRTGRAGANGKAISFCDTEERAYLSDIRKLTSSIKEVKDHPFISTFIESKATPSRNNFGSAPRKRITEESKNYKKNWSRNYRAV